MSRFLVKSLMVYENFWMTVLNAGVTKIEIVTLNS